MNISKDGDELVVRIPLKQKENNCYMDDEDLGMTNNLIGIIAGNDFSLSQLNDLSYKGDQQEGMPIIMFTDSDDLRQVCKEFGIDVWEHPVCAYCNGVIRGVFTYGDKGNKCFGCELKKNL